MGERARVRLIRASQSDELRETFRQLAEIEGPEGPKFPRRVLMELAARIVGRAYEPMLLELCHLARAALLSARCGSGARSAGAGQAGTGFEWIFWGVEEARTGAFRAAFSRPPGGNGRRTGAGGALSISDEAVTLDYADSRFEVRYGRMANLAAMMELLVSTLGYRALVDALDPLAAPVLDRGAVSGVSRDLARRLYGWLGDHLPAAQAQRKFHAMIAFLEEALGDDFTEEDIDDQAILRFWLRQSAPDASAPDPDRAGSAAGVNADFRGYRNTFLAFLALARVLATGAEIGRFERRTPIGPDFEAGEIDPATSSPQTESVPDEDPLARLQEEPAAAVKALNRRELALLHLPVEENEGVRRLPRSYLRAECFGPVQNRISQALRRKAEAAELAALIAAGPDPGYRARIEALEKAGGHVRRVSKACLYVLHRTGAERGGRADRSDGRGYGAGADADAGVPKLDFRLLGEARTAFESLNRAGFGRSAPSDPGLAPAYAALAEQLPVVAERLGEVLRALGPPGAWEAAEAEDRPVFARAFTRLYGAEPGAERAAAGSGACEGGGANRDQVRTPVRGTGSTPGGRAKSTGERP